MWSLYIIQSSCQEIGLHYHNVPKPRLILEKVFFYFFFLPFLLYFLYNEQGIGMNGLFICMEITLQAELWYWETQEM